MSMLPDADMHRRRKMSKNTHAQHREAVPAQQLPGNLENPKETWGSPAAGKSIPTPSGLLL